MAIGRLLFTHGVEHCIRGKTRLTTAGSSFCLSCGLSILCPSCEVVCSVGSTLFLLLRGSPSTRSTACLFAEVTDEEFVENHAESFGRFRAGGLVDLGGLGIDVGTDMDMDKDMVVNL